MAVKIKIICKYIQIKIYKMMYKLINKSNVVFINVKNHYKAFLSSINIYKMNVNMCMKNVLNATKSTLNNPDIQIVL
jgi:hypothetical protein